MATVCVKSVVSSPEKLPTTSYSWRSSKTSRMSKESQPLDPHELENNEDPVDFEFLLEDPVTMLTADELFSDGKLLPLKFSGAIGSREKKPTTKSVVNTAAKPCRLMEMEISGVDPYTFSPRAPRCTVRWRELLGLKRLAKTRDETSSLSRLSTSTPNPKTASFKDSDTSSISSSRLSLSSSSHELDDAPNPFAQSRDSRAHLRNPKPRRRLPTERALTVTADSPRLNASGKIVFHGLERSSSSPGNYTGGPRMKHHHGMPRSQSANVRMNPVVLNVPVSSLRGGSKSGTLSFGQLFTGNNNNTKNRTNRTRLEPTS